MSESTLQNSATDERRLTGREKADMKIVEELGRKGLGDLIDEIISIGNRESVYVKRDRRNVMRSKALSDEINRRWKAFEDFRDEIGRRLGVVEGFASRETDQIDDRNERTGEPEVGN